MKGVENMMILVILVIVAWCCIWGVATQSIGNSKGINGSFWWGFFLGIIGLIVVACMKDNSTVSNKSDNVEALDKLQKLKENGTISEAEFEDSKKKLLSKL